MNARDKKKTKGDKGSETMCVIVMNSYAITGAMVQQFSGKETIGKPVVLFSCVEKVPMRHGGDALHLEILMQETAKHVMRRCAKALPNPQKIVCTIGEPWVITHQRGIHLEKRTPFTVTQKIIDDMIARDQKMLEQELVSQMSPDDEQVFLDTARPIVSVNGYRTNQYLKASAETLDISVTYARAPRRLIESFLESTIDVFHRDDVRFQAMRVHTSGTVLELGGMTSMLAVMDNGIVAERVSLPMGLVALEKSLMNALNTQSHQLPSIMQLIADERTLVSQDDQIRIAYAPLGDAIDHGALLLQKFRHVIPTPLVVVGTAPWLGVMKSLLQHVASHIVVNPVHADTILTAHGVTPVSLVLGSAIHDALD